MYLESLVKITGRIVKSTPFGADLFHTICNYFKLSFQNEIKEGLRCTILDFGSTAQ